MSTTQKAESNSPGRHTQLQAAQYFSSYVYILHLCHYLTGDCCCVFVLIPLVSFSYMYRIRIGACNCAPFSVAVNKTLCNHFRCMVGLSWDHLSSISVVISLNSIAVERSLFVRVSATIERSVSNFCQDGLHCIQKAAHQKDCKALTIQLLKICVQSNWYCKIFQCFWAYGVYLQTAWFG